MERDGLKGDEGKGKWQGRERKGRGEAPPPQTKNNCYTTFS